MTQTTLSFPDLTRPRNQKAHVLYLLLTKKYLSEQDTSFNAFRSRLSELKREPYNLPVQFIRKPFVTVLGKKSKYKKHFILPEDREYCLEVYNKINN